MTAQTVIPLAQETREVLSCREAAPHLGLKPRTLTAWGQGKGKPLLTPVKIGRRTMWRVAEIKALLGVSEAKGS